MYRRAVRRIVLFSEAATVPLLVAAVCLYIVFPSSILNLPRVYVVYLLAALPILFIASWNHTNFPLIVPYLPFLFAISLTVIFGPIPSKLYKSKELVIYIATSYFFASGFRTEKHLRTLAYSGSIVVSLGAALYVFTAFIGSEVLGHLRFKDSLFGFISGQYPIGMNCLAFVPVMFGVNSSSKSKLLKLISLFALALLLEALVLTTLRTYMLALAFMCLCYAALDRSKGAILSLVSMLIFAAMIIGTEVLVETNKLNADSAAARSGGSRYAVITHLVSEGKTKSMPQPQLTNRNNATNVVLQSDLPSPQKEGTAITFRALIQGSAESAEYEFWLHDLNGRKYTLLRRYNEKNSFVFDTTGRSGKFEIIVWVREKGSRKHTDAGVAVPYEIIPDILKGEDQRQKVILVPGLPSPQPEGKIVELIAKAQQGAAKYTYKFLLQRPGSAKRWIVLRDFTKENVLYWDTHGYPGINQIRVVARRISSNDEQLSPPIGYVISSTMVKTLWGLVRKLDISSSIRIRLAAMCGAADLFISGGLRQKLLGIGLKNSDSMIGHFVPADLYYYDTVLERPVMKRIRDQAGLDAHNTCLTILIENGIVGIIGFCLMIILVLLPLRKPAGGLTREKKIKKNVLITLLLGFLVVGLLFWGMHFNLIFWVLLGLINGMS